MSTAPWQRPWIKLWVETLSDPKVVDALEPAQRWVWLALLMATAKSPEAGVMLLPSGRPMSVRQIWQATRSTDMGLDEFQVALSLMEEQQMVRWREDDHALIIVNWHERQDPQTAAQRMQRYRSRKRGSNGSEDVTPPVTERHGETLQEPLRGVTPGVTDPLQKVTQEGERGRGAEEQRNRSGDSVPSAEVTGSSEPSTSPDPTGLSPPVSYRDWATLLDEATNGRESIGTLADFARAQYPQNLQGGSGPTLQQVASNIGGILQTSNLDAVDLFKLMWRLAANEPGGDFLAYVRSAVKRQEENHGGKQRAAGRGEEWPGMVVEDDGPAEPEPES